MATLDRKYYDYYRLLKHEPITKFEDIKVGETYHIPPLISFDRRDIIVEQKDYNKISGKVREDNGPWKYGSFYRTEIAMRYIVKINK